MSIKYVSLNFRPNVLAVREADIIELRIIKPVEDENADTVEIIRRSLAR